MTNSSTFSKVAVCLIVLALSLTARPAHATVIEIKRLSDYSFSIRGNGEVGFAERFLSMYIFDADDLFGLDADSFTPGFTINSSPVSRAYHNFCSCVSNLILEFSTPFDADDHYIGEATFAFPSTRRLLAVGTSGNIQVGNAGVNGTWSIVSDFTIPIGVAPVPLPASSILLLSGIGGFALIRRRQKSKDS